MVRNSFLPVRLKHYLLSITFFLKLKQNTGLLLIIILKKYWRALRRRDSGAAALVGIRTEAKKI